MTRMDQRPRRITRACPSIVRLALAFVIVGLAAVGAAAAAPRQSALHPGQIIRPTLRATVTGQLRDPWHGPSLPAPTIRPHPAKLTMDPVDYQAAKAGANERFGPRPIGAFRANSLPQPRRGFSSTERTLAEPALRGVNRAAANELTSGVGRPTRTELREPSTTVRSPTRAWTCT